MKLWILFLYISVSIPLGRAQTWPGKDWNLRNPERQNPSAAGLEAAAASAEKYGGGSGRIIRYGHHVKERRSQLPGGEAWGKRMAGFFRLAVESAREPYPLSPVIQKIEWASLSSVVRKARGSDNWPLTWGDDGHLYTAYGDGWGFDPRVPEKLSLGFARIEDHPENFTGINIRAPTLEQKGDGRSGKKASGILMVKGILYLWVRNAGNSQLAWSRDHGKTWTWSPWKFETSFGCPTFLNFGKNYGGARDGYIYIYSHDSDSAYEPAGRMVLARVPAGKITLREAYEFFQSTDSAGNPSWGRDIRRRGPVFEHPDRCYRSGITYHPALKRYLWCQVIPGEDTRFQGGFGIYDAPEPWGPWTTAYFTERWDTGPGETCSIPSKWMATDGRVIHLVFSGEDCFSVRRATLTRKVNEKQTEGGEAMNE